MFNLLFGLDIVCCVAAGHPKHEWTSCSSFESVFKFFDEHYRRRIAAADDDDDGGGGGGGDGGSGGDEDVDGGRELCSLYLWFCVLVDETLSFFVWKLSAAKL